jgi:ABC-2 type transport system ATP-binding protein
VDTEINRPVVPFNVVSSQTVGMSLSHDSASYDTVIEAVGLTKMYKTPKVKEPRTVVDHLNLTVHRGEVLSLLGPNGAGKTTTVEMMAGFRRPQSGAVTVLGADPWQAPAAWRARIGMVLQQNKSSDEVTVEEQLQVQRTYFEHSRSVDEVLELVGLTEHRRQRVPKLSGGQARRLDVGCGIIGKPELLFLDEPTTGFDPEARRQFWDLIRLLASEGTTILLTTHYLDEAEALADRVAVIIAGKVRALGTPADLRHGSSAQTVVCWGSGADRQEVATLTPTKTVRELMTQFDDEIPDLAVIRPSLEDAYLKLVEEHAV